MGVWCIYLQNNGLILQKWPVLSSKEHIYLIERKENNLSVTG